jgi:hypothetical protein
VIKCDDDCIPLCDFCRHWKCVSIDFWGDCSIKQMRTVLYDECDDFHCFKVSDEEAGK